jgi:hypothetical protein
MEKLHVVDRETAKVRQEASKAARSIKQIADNNNEYCINNKNNELLVCEVILHFNINKWEMLTDSAKLFYIDLYKKEKLSERKKQDGRRKFENFSSISTKYNIELMLSEQNKCVVSNNTDYLDVIVSYIKSNKRLYSMLVQNKAYSTIAKQMSGVKVKGLYNFYHEFKPRFNM